MSWATKIPSLREVLLKHFPDATTEQIKSFADEIYDGSSPARPLQWMERNDNKPTVEIENLRKASKLVQDAAENIKKLGWHGGEAVQDYSGKLWAQENQISSTPALSNEGAIAVLAGILAKMSEQLSECARTIDPNAPSVMSAFGIDEPAGRRRGRPAATHAYFTAREVYTVYENITGRTPTVTTNPHADGNPASGPFLKLVKDVFDALELEESSETWARAVCKENNAPKR
jgi:hypothetical protein